MTESNLNIVLANVMCCLAQKGYDVSNMYSVGNKCADEELLKLKILQDKFESLKCYNFNSTITSTNTPSIFTLDLTELESEAFNDYIPNKDPWLIIVNTTQYSGTGDGNISIKELLEILVPTTEPITRVCTTNCLHTLKANCDVTFIRVEFTINAVEYKFTFDLITQGTCSSTTIESTNCLTSEDMDKLAHDLMEECDICDCQLNQE